MDIDNLISYVEDKEIVINNDWYLHATKDDVNVVKEILENGIKCAYLRGMNGNHFNGKYYISLYKPNTENKGLKEWLSGNPSFVIDGINPVYANRRQLNIRRIFINSKIPLRTSEWDDEYQQYMFIEPSKFVALGYDLSYTLHEVFCNDKVIKEKLLNEKLLLLKNILIYMNEANNKLPVYDFSTNREINRDKVLSLHL